MSVTDINQRIEKALFCRMMARATIPLLASVIGSVLMMVSQMSTDRSVLFLGWMCMVFAVVAFRFWLIDSLKKQISGGGWTRHMLFFYCISIAVSGLSWGALSLMIVDAPAMTVIIVTTAVQATVMGAVLTMSASLPVFFSYSLPAMLPMVYFYASEHYAQSGIMALYSLIYYAMMVFMAYQFNKTMREHLRVGFENEDLIASLKDANETISSYHCALEPAKYHDLLTGLPNRLLFEHRLQQCLQISHQKGFSVAVLVLDLDNFKAVNDRLGYEAGDVVLKAVALRLKTVLRLSDTLARVGSDGFALILDDMDSRATVQLVAEKCLSVFSKPFVCADQHVIVNASVGLIMCEPMSSSDSVFDQAGAAVYQAKLMGGGFCWAN